MRQVEVESVVSLEGCGTGGYVVGFNGRFMSMSFENFQDFCDFLGWNSGQTRFRSCSSIRRFFLFWQVMLVFSLWRIWRLLLDTTL